MPLGIQQNTHLQVISYMESYWHYVKRDLLLAHMIGFIVQSKCIMLSSRQDMDELVNISMVKSFFFAHGIGSQLGLCQIFHLPWQHLCLE